MMSSRLWPKGWMAMERSKDMIIGLKFMTSNLEWTLRTAEPSSSTVLLNSLPLLCHFFLSFPLFQTSSSPSSFLTDCFALINWENNANQKVCRVPPPHLLVCLHVHTYIKLSISCGWIGHVPCKGELSTCAPDLLSSHLLKISVLIYFFCSPIQMFIPSY